MAAAYFNVKINGYSVLMEITYQSDQVSRYKGKLLDKYFTIEQHHLKKSDKWKITSCTPNIDIEKLMAALPEISQGIEDYFKPREKKKSW
jgi:hypothetical protein